MARPTPQQEGFALKPLGYGDPLRLGPYRIIGTLGEGGMGKVYLGRDGSGEVAAVKVLRPELAHETHMSQRFVREAQAAQAVRSKGVARVLTAQTDGGAPFIATEFLAGPTLDRAVERHGPFPEPEVRALGAALARTLGDIHAAGLVHRDLKPSNIVLTSGGPRIIDFGIARPEHGLTLTTTGQAPVTPGYGAPEQVLGQRTGPPGDVFALGAVLVFAASGERAYQGDQIAVVQYEVVHGEPRLEGVPEALVPLIAPCLTKDAAQRPQPAQITSALAPPRDGAQLWKKGGLADDIAEAESAAKQLATFPPAPGSQNGTAATGPAAGSAAPPPADSPTRRRVLTGLAAGGTLLVAGGGTAWWLTREEPPRRAHPWFALPLQDGEYEEGRAPEPLWGPRDVAFAQSPAPLVSRDLVVVGGKRDARVTAFSVRDGKRKWVSEAAFYQPLFAASPRLIVTGGSDGQLFGVDARTGAVERRHPTGMSVLLAVDARAAYCLVEDEVRCVELVSGKVRWRKPAPLDEFSGGRGISATAAGGLLVLATAKDAAIALDVRTGGKVWSRPGGSTGAGVPPVTAGGEVYLGGQSLSAVRLRDGEEQWSVPAEVNEGWSGPAVQGDAVYASAGSEVRCRGRRDGREVWRREVDGGVFAGGRPVAEGNTVWVTLKETAGVAALDTRTGRAAWVRRHKDGGSVRMTGAGNRVFLLTEGKLTAMPVI
ncbi:hypothetical protein AN219_21105 [Streptomyces nanshensis]|nr:hypothetical protein AN219_21105 [Streptomyces nanshensis]